MRRRRLKAAEAVRIRDEWLGVVDALKDEVCIWAEQQGWKVTQSEREVTEEGLGTYKVPVLEIDAPQGQLILDPIARFVMGAAGRVDLSVWPSLYRVMLLRNSGPNWVVRTESGINWPNPWGRHTFVDLAERLLQVA